jgi:hypothetical protein
MMKRLTIASHKQDESIYYKTYILSKRASQEIPVRVADFFLFFAKPRGMPSLFYITSFLRGSSPGDFRAL